MVNLLVVTGLKRWQPNTHVLNEQSLFDACGGMGGGGGRKEGGDHKVFGESGGWVSRHQQSIKMGELAGRA